MRAKRKGTDSYSRVARIQLENSDILYDPSVMEFEPDTPSTDSKPCPQMEEEKHWQEVREKAAIAAMQGTITSMGGDFQTFNDVVVGGFTGKQKTFPNEIAEFAVACADALVKQLKAE